MEGTMVPVDCGSGGSILRCPDLQIHWKLQVPGNHVRSNPSDDLGIRSNSRANINNSNAGTKMQTAGRYSINGPSPHPLSSHRKLCRGLQIGLSMSLSLEDLCQLQAGSRSRFPALTWPMLTLTSLRGFMQSRLRSSHKVAADMNSKLCSWG